MWFNFSAPTSLPDKPKLVFANYPRMSEVELGQAFAVGERVAWFRGVMQTVDDFRSDAAEAAASHGATNNALAMAGAVGAHEVLTNLLAYFERMRSEAVKGSEL
jgi:hypothetical protein